MAYREFGIEGRKPERVSRIADPTEFDDRSPGRVPRAEFRRGTAEDGIEIELGRILVVASGADACDMVVAVFGREQSPGSRIRAPFYAVSSSGAEVDVLVGVGDVNILLDRDGVDTAVALVNAVVETAKPRAIVVFSSGDAHESDLAEGDDVGLRVVSNGALDISIKCLESPKYLSGVAAASIHTEIPSIAFHSLRPARTRGSCVQDWSTALQEALPKWIKSKELEMEPIDLESSRLQPRVSQASRLINQRARSVFGTMFL